MLLIVPLLGNEKLDKIAHLGMQCWGQLLKHFDERFLKRSDLRQYHEDSLRSW